MALDKLGIYNNALTNLGQRKLSLITEERESRRILDEVYDFGAVEYCLELVKPVFARKTIGSLSAATSSGHGFTSVHSLPSDFLCIVGVYSDPKLDQEVTRYIEEDRTISCDYSQIYIRYVTTDNKEVYGDWSPTFFKVVSAYLAQEASIRLAPKKTEGVIAYFTAKVEEALEIEFRKEPSERTKESTRTLTNEWLPIYNDALSILGQTRIVDINDDSNRRSVLDTVLDNEIVEFVLEDIGWHWAITSDKITYNPSLDPEWGYQYAFDKPAKMHRFDGIWYDEYFSTPVKYYTDENDTIFCDAQELYVKYVSSDYLVNVSLWKPHFKRLVAAYMAKEAAPNLAPEKYNDAEEELKDRNSKSKSIDAMQSPPQVLTRGSWARAMLRGNGRRNRP